MQQKMLPLLWMRKEEELENLSALGITCQALADLLIFNGDYCREKAQEDICRM